jgi:hypothetical protein
MRSIWSSQSIGIGQRLALIYLLNCEINASVVGFAPPTHVFVREGNHVHWKVHIPKELIDEFINLVPRWVTSLGNKGKPGPRKRSEKTPPASDGVVNIRPVYNNVGLRKYLLKGVNPADAFRFGIRHVEPQGEVIGRRTGVSRSLGSGARKAAGYKSLPPHWLKGRGKTGVRFSPVGMTEQAN